MKAWILLLLWSLPVAAEDRKPEAAAAKAAQLERIALEVSTVSQQAPKPAREWAALMLAVGYHESAFSLRIAAGRCRPHECDRGRARGLWQNHRNSLNGELWESAPGNLEAQARMAFDGLRRAYWTCARSGVPWVRGTINAYAGKRCSARWPGLEQRLATYRRLVSQ